MIKNNIFTLSNILLTNFWQLVINKFAFIEINSQYLRNHQPQAIAITAILSEDLIFNVYLKLNCILINMTYGNLSFNLMIKVFCNGDESPVVYSLNTITFTSPF